MPAPPSNPFATRFVRPGELPFEFTDGTTLDQLVTHLVAQRGWGQIVGPHGSGKSTLLASLRLPLQQRGYHLQHFTVRSDHRALDVRRAERARWNDRTLIMVDGFEQLSCWARRRLCRQCRQSGTALLITAHRSLGLPELYTTRPTRELAERLCERLLQGAAPTPHSQLDAAWRRQPGNIREILFELYDWHETQQRHEMQQGA